MQLYEVIWKDQFIEKFSVFPDLNTVNNTYQALQRETDAIAISQTAIANKLKKALFFVVFLFILRINKTLGTAR